MTINRGRAIAAIVGVSVISLVTAWALTSRENQRVPPIAIPSESPSPEETEPPAVGKDIGLGFPVCDITRLRGIDLLGDGTDGTAWTATAVGHNRKCPREIEDSYLVAVDVTGDGEADASWEALRYCVMCKPYAAVDLDGDGSEELLVIMQGGSVTQFGVFDATESGGSVEFGPVRVGEPGDRTGGFPAGDIASIWVGGDEGFSGKFSCENYPEDPVLVVGWRNHPIEEPDAGVTEVHIVRLTLRDGVFEVDALNTEQPTDDPMPEGFPTGTRGCGIDLDLFR